MPFSRNRNAFGNCNCLPNSAGALAMMVRTALENEACTIGEVLTGSPLLKLSLSAISLKGRPRGLSTS